MRYFTTEPPSTIASGVSLLVSEDDSTVSSGGTEVTPLKKGCSPFTTLHRVIYFTASGFVLADAAANIAYCIAVRARV